MDYFEPNPSPPLIAPWLQVRREGLTYRPHLVRIRRRWFTKTEILKLDLERHGHSHCIYHLIYYLEGANTIVVDDHTVSVQAGQMVLIDPNVFHNVIPRKPMDCSFLTLMFTYRCGKVLLEEPFEWLLEALTGIQFRPQVVVDDIHGLFRGFFAILETDVSAPQDQAIKSTSYCLAGLFNELQGVYLRRAEFSAIPDDIMAVRRFIIQNAHSPITVETLKKIAGLSRSQLITKFKRYFGRTPIDFLIYERIEKAKTYLIHSTKRINEIAWLCGFQSEFYFCKAFKMRTEQTPGEFRNKAHQHVEFHD